MPVPAVMKRGMPTVSAGSQIVTAGISFGWKMIFFLWVAELVSTPARPTSLPVPAVVGTAMIGAIFDGIGAGVPVVDILQIPDRQVLPLMRHEGDHLAKVEGRAAAEADHPVMAAGEVDRDPGGHVRLVRVRVDVGEDGAAHAGLVQHIQRGGGDRQAMASALSVTRSGFFSPMLSAWSASSAIRPTPNLMAVG